MKQQKRRWEKTKAARIEQLKPYRWVPGQSGNPKGAPKGRAWQADLRELLAETVGKKGHDRQSLLLAALVKMAGKGNIRAIQTLLDILPERTPTKSAITNTQGEDIHGTLSDEELIEKAKWIIEHRAEKIP